MEYMKLMKDFCLTQIWKKNVSWRGNVQVTKQERQEKLLQMKELIQLDMHSNQ